MKRSERDHSRLEFRVLGGLEVLYRRQVVAGFESRKVCGLLVYLLLQRGRGVTRDRLASLFWPEHSDAAARRNLRQALFNLRATLRPARHLARGLASVSLPVETGACDALLFEELAAAPAAAAWTQALDLYRGDLLAGFFVRDSQPFEDWLAAERERLRDLAIRAGQALLLHHAERGAWEAGIACARRLAEIDPLSEVAHRHLMLFYSRSGRRAKALAQFERLRQLLDDELGIDPSDETKEVRRVILVEETPPAGGAPPPAEPAAPFLPLVARDASLAQLRDAWGAVCSGRARVTLIAGEAGAGKTRLARSFLAGALERDPAAVLQCRCVDAATQPPLQAIHDLVASVSAERVSGLAPAAGLGDDPSRPSAADLERWIVALAGGVRRGRERPVILFLDDLHLASGAVHAVLGDLARRLARRRVWLLATVDSSALAEGRSLRARSLAGLQADDLVALERLGAAALAEVARGLVAGAAAADLARALGPVTQGLPLAVAEAVNLLWDQAATRPSALGWGAASGHELRGIAGLADLVRRRVSLLPSSARRLLTLAAVLGDRFDSEPIQTADRESRVVVEAGLEILIERWLVRPWLRSWVSSRRQRDIVLWGGGERRGAFEFTHPAVRQAVYRHLNPQRRRTLHLQVAHALAAGPRTPGSCEVLAHHYEEARAWDEALPHLEAAAARSRAAGDGDAALHHERRAQLARAGGGVTPVNAWRRPRALG